MLDSKVNSKMMPCKLCCNQEPERYQAHFLPEARPVGGVRFGNVAPASSLFEEAIFDCKYGYDLEDSSI
jgi:hypothetical protein